MTLPPLDTTLDRALASLTRGDLPDATDALRAAWAAAADASPAQRVRLALAAAELARRRGTALDARARIREARAALADADDPDRRALEPEVVWAEAVDATEHGAYGLAERLLTGALASVLPGPRTTRFHAALGALAARQGRPAVAALRYRLALDQTDRPDDAARLRSNLAMTAHLRGATAEGLAHIDAALAHRDRPGAPPGPCANSLAVRAMLLDAARDPAADQTWDLALAKAEAAADAPLWCEIALHRATAWRRGGDVLAADALQADVDVRLGDAGRQDPTLAALHTEARARALHDRGGPATRALTDALTTFQQLGSTWHELRLQLLLGAWEHAAGRAATAVDRVGRACRRAVLHGLVLPDEPATRAVVLAAAAAGQPGAAAYARARAWPAPAPTRGAVLHRRSGLLTIDDARWHLGRLSTRLLTMLAQAGPAGMTTTRLGERLWRDDPTDPVGRLRMLVSRTRRLTEPAHLLILTSRGPRGVGRYRWNPDVPVELIG
jgi:hypothetical protein